MSFISLPEPVSELAPTPSPMPAFSLAGRLALITGGGTGLATAQAGFIETATSRPAMSSDPDRRARALRRTPMGEFGRPEDVGHATVFLASDAVRYITGVSLPVDGGNSIGF